MGVFASAERCQDLAPVPEHLGDAGPDRHKPTSFDVRKWASACTYLPGVRAEVQGVQDRTRLLVITYRLCGYSQGWSQPEITWVASPAFVASIHAVRTAR